MRIAVGQLWQETNTFNPLPTTRADFDQFGVLHGDALIEQMADTNELGGFIQSLRAWPERPEIVGLVRLPAWPGGVVTAETFDWILSEFTSAVCRAMPVDGVLLALHGAMVADRHPDVEGEVLQAVRQLLGAVPLVATLDLHANVTRKMVDAADALVLFHTAPHIDVFETGQRGARLLRRILIEGARPVTAFQKLSMVVPAERANTQDPASVSYGFRERLQALERTPGILAAGLATVQPWLDVPELGSSVVVVADATHAIPPRGGISRTENMTSHEVCDTPGEVACRDLAEELWQRRRDYLPELVPVEQAVREAHEAGDGLVVLSDSADATTSGAPGDSTWVFKELLTYDWPHGALVPLVAPEIVERATALGEGAPLRAAIGGVRDARFSQPVEIDARIERLFRAEFVLSGHLAKNLPVDMGPSAVLRCGDVLVFVTSKSGPHFAPEFFRSAGFDPFAASVVVAKSPCGFRAAYADRAKRIIVVRAPGCAPADFWNYPYRNIPRPLWPWDDL
ncbi:MAG TPA: M81 family metallopeptidase [Pirellulales bacterium]|nr:M81 family metallopeptidase [Pirellulales bacterium]